ncbi:MAG TPA: hypothetical protein VNJ01_15045 [Bacteriovoracaceae bacterium]|nr:hypothetical protein [Bacteriovoracaceae bacterium]
MKLFLSMIIILGTFGSSFAQADSSEESYSCVIDFKGNKITLATKVMDFTEKTFLSASGEKLTAQLQLHYRENENGQKVHMLRAAVNSKREGAIVQMYLHPVDVSQSKIEGGTYVGGVWNTLTCKKLN